MIAKTTLSRRDRLVVNDLGVSSTHADSAASKNDSNVIMPTVIARTLRIRKKMSKIDNISLRNRNLLKRKKKKIAFALTASSMNNNKSIVSDDDDSKNEKSVNDSTKILIKVSPPLKLPLLQLKTSQIHSKKYPFPHKLFDLVSEATSDDDSSKVVSWSSDGTTFIVHDHAKFATEFLPTYFGHTQLRSFDRQLNYWGFETISPRTINNKSFGGKSWKHQFFQKDKRDLLKNVIRKTVKGSTSSKKNRHDILNQQARTTVQRSPKPSSPKKNNAMMKPCDVTSMGNKTRNRVIECRQEIDAMKTDMNSTPTTKVLKSSSSAKSLTPRMVSPVQRLSCAIDRNDSFTQTGFVSATAMIERDNINYSSTNVFANDLEDDFLPLIPLELFKEENVCDVEPIAANDIAPIPFRELPTGNGYDFFHKVDDPMGNIFQDVDFDMDMGIEAESFLDVIEDIDDCNDKQHFSSSHVKRGNADCTADKHSVENDFCF